MQLCDTMDEQVLFCINKITRIQVDWIETKYTSIQVHFPYQISIALPIHIPINTLHLALP